jgi:dihydroorotate dehydrogenase
MQKSLGVLLSLLIIVFSLIGIADSGYITYERFSGQIPPCGQGFDCDSVLNSKWANFGPIPVSLLGMLFYSTVFVVGIAHYLQLDLASAVTRYIPTKRKKAGSIFRLITPLELLLLISSAGFLFSIYLISIMAFVLQAWCVYCVISAFTSTGIFLMTAIYYSRVAEHSPFMMKTLVSAIFGWVYTNLVKRFFFLLDPEFVHNRMTIAGATLGSFSLTRDLTSAFFNFSHPKLIKKLDGISFPNPVGLAAGFDYNGELTQILPAVGFGFHTIGTVTLRPYEGNQPPRLGRFIKSKGLLVNKGLKSWGAPEVIRRLTGLQFRIPVGISIASTNTLFNSDKEQIMDIIRCFALFEKSQVRHSYYELNISCPNTFGGEPFTTPARLEVLLRALDQLKLSRPVYVKMPIDQSEAETLGMLEVIDRHNIAGVIFGNLTKDRKNPLVHAEDKKEWKNLKGNVSGKPTFERSNRLIDLVKKTYGQRFTIIGTGGVFNPEDAQKKLELGADLVQLITGMVFQGPQLIGQINNQLARKITRAN